MARENQGLQIALIIFVILTIALGVTTFMFFKQFDEAQLRANANAENLAKQEQVTKTVTEERNKLREEMMGFKESDSIEAIRKEFNKDVQLYGSAYEAPLQHYHQLLPKLFDDLQKKNASLADAQVKIQDLTKEKDKLKQDNAALVKKFEDAATQAGEQLATATKQFGDDVGKLTQAKDTLAADKQKAQKEAEKTQDELKAKLDTAGKQLLRLRDLADTRAKQLEDAKKETFEVAYGQVRWVNQRNGTVWVNLGQADHLGRQTSFAVYAEDTNDVSRAAKKGAIEVTQILGEHLAEARILEDSPSNPIMPGDVIFTPLWRPGEQLHVALAGDLDVDGDGKSDVQLLLNLTSINGAVVDLYVDENGNRQPKNAKMSAETRYLVLGKAPEVKKGDKGEESRSKVHTSIENEAKQLGIKTMPLQEFLNRIGYKHETHVVRFGRGANPADFKPLPPEGSQKTSSGNLAPIFKERRPTGAPSSSPAPAPSPSRRTSGSAY